MNKRDFLGAAALYAASLPASASRARLPASAPSTGPALLTVTGAIGASNRGAFDPALDQLMKKQNLKFERAHAFDFGALASLPAVRIAPTLEYDGKPHALRGPLLVDVLRAAGAAPAARALLRAIDGYAVPLTADDMRKYRFIVATHLDDKPLPLGGLGPLWAVYDADRIPELAAKPLNQRFASCPWGLYHIEAI